MCCVISGLRVRVYQMCWNSYSVNMAMYNTAAAIVMFFLGGFILDALVSSCHSHEQPRFKQTVSDIGNFSLAIEMSPMVVIMGHTTDPRIDHIIRTTSLQKKAVILDVGAFPSMISSHISTVMLYSNLGSVKRNLNFLVLADIGTINVLLHKAQQLDQDLGAGLLLRHFSRWLLVLTTGNVDALIMDDIVLDNVAVTTIDNVSGNLCENITLLQTLMWKKASRQLQHVSHVPTEDLSSRVFPNTKTGLNGRELKVAILPWFSCKVNYKAKTSSGPCHKLISHLSEVLNFSFTYIVPEDRSWGLHDNGTWTGVIGLLVNKTVDISAAPYGINPLRLKYLTFMYPLRWAGADILYKKLDSRVNGAALLSYFEWQFYVCLLVVLLGVATFLLIFNRLIPKERTRNDGYQTPETIMSTVGVVCNQGSSTRPSTESYRILLAFWWLTCIPVMSVFSGNLVAFLTVNMDDVPFTGLEDVLASGYDIGIETGSYVADALRMSNDPINKQIWKKTREHQHDNLTIEEDRMYHRTRLDEGRYAFITTKLTISSYMVETCDMDHTRNQLFQRPASLIVPKHSPLALLMDPELLFLVDRGIINKWYEEPQQDGNLCSPKDEGEHVLKLMDLFTVVAVLGCGVGIAAVVLIVEICKSKLLHTRTR